MTQPNKAEDRIREVCAAFGPDCQPWQLVQRVKGLKAKVERFREDRDRARGEQLRAEVDREAAWAQVHYRVPLLDHAAPVLVPLDEYVRAILIELRSLAPHSRVADLCRRAAVALQHIEATQPQPTAPEERR